MSIWWQISNFVFSCPKRWFQFNSRMVRTHFSSIMTSNNWKMIAETRSYIFRWRSRFRRRRVCLSSLLLSNDDDGSENVMWNEISQFTISLAIWFGSQNVPRHQSSRFFQCCVFLLSVPWTESLALASRLSSADLVETLVALISCFSVLHYYNLMFHVFN